MKTINNIILACLLVYTMQLTGHAQSLTIEQVKDSTFAVTASGVPAKNKLHWNRMPDTWSETYVLALTKPTEIVELPAIHPILKLEKSTSKAVYVAPRGIKLQGAVNFRDIGGYTTHDGRQVKWGKIYRSADISKLTDDDLRVMSALNVRMVCDLRGENEAAMAPDRLPAETGRVLLPAGSENVGGANSFTKYMRTPERADSMMRAFYSRTDHLGKKYKPMFEELFKLQPDQSMMFHCTAGKDRTGVGAALILFALGVDEASIYQDYEATNEFRKDSNEQFIKALIAQGVSEQAARNMMAAKAEYLKAAFDAITAQYGSIDSFLEKEIGLTADRKTLLREKFLYN